MGDNPMRAADRHRTARTIVAISQVYPPDPTSLGQHLADATAELARRGNRVIVYTADRAYEDPSIRYPRREMRDGVEVVRLPFSSFGKGSLLARLAGGIAFLMQAVVRALLIPKLGTVLVSTSPPMAGLAGVLLAGPRRARLVYWVMDLNPDQAVALGVVSSRSPFAVLYDWMNRAVLRRAAAVVAMDRFMGRRLMNKQRIDGRLHVLPPWPHEDPGTPIPRDGNSFRAAHGLGGKFVVMYSGNHSLANPLRTVIDAAIALQDDPAIAFVFVGGGAGKREVEAAHARNIVSLPYQPLACLNESLSAADVHVVTMGNDMVGIIHPCKAYGAFSVERPIVFVGPPDSHITDILESAPVGWHVAHGDVSGMVSRVRALATMPRGELTAFGTRAGGLVRDRLSKERLCGAFCDIVEASGPVRAEASPR
jgi:colanic acid biosynthesis glycosyl transferase WcaI